ncbi:TetR family transcriptional regulator [Actinosynnema sp. ALI-1.44]|uniref:TetR/AcrR family transcriptional regulator n=1 Tax=Actinosynnema sp. ALI-1.44 TaxID=1933779 RepID=UPI00097C732B|nr:TetR/AcrR family transcriptional regulator [Actinosynnema sp. ALI-1.44]ONI70250.1 TetR family transcriptional regulator [Actinosynnema sp. ALI-1.44]
MTMSLPADLWPDVKPDAARRLMYAAVESFAKVGFHGTTTRDIATAAGMSPAALYVHFSSKAALLFAISRDGHERTLEMVQRVAGTDGSPVDRVRLLVERFVEWHARRHVVARVVQYELEALPADEYTTVAALRRRIEQVVQSLIADGVKDGSFTVPDEKIAARAVLSLGIDVARWYSERARKTPKALGREYATLVLRMLGSSAQ